MSITFNVDLSSATTIDGAPVYTAEQIGAVPINSSGKISSTYLPDQASLDVEVDSKIEAHSNDTTSVHGIANTANLVFTNDARLAPTGNTIVVDSNIAAAVAASEIGDLIFVKRGSYTITSTISLNGKGDIQFETGTIVNVAGGITAFSTSENKTIIGDAFVLSDTAKLVAVSGGTLRFEFSNISSTSTGTLFTVTAGTIDTSFASIVATSARAFELRGTGSMRIRRSHSVSCQQFLYANTTGGATIDLWTVVGNSPDTVIYIDNIVGLSYRGVNCNSSAGQNSYAGGYKGPVNWISNLGAANFIITDSSIQLDSPSGGGFGYAINTTQAQITSPSRYSFSSKLKWNASRHPTLSWYGPAGLVLSDSDNLGGNYLVIALQPVLDDTWARPFIDFKLGANNTGSAIVYSNSSWSGVATTLNSDGAIRLQNQPTPAEITVVKTSKESLGVVINSPLDGNRIINIKFTTQETIDAFNSFKNFGYAAYLSDWTFSDQVIEGNLAPTIFFNYPQSTSVGGPIAELNPVLRNIRVNTANPRTPATILTTNAQRYFYLDNVKIASWVNCLSIDSLAANTPVVAYNVYSNRPAGSNIAMIGDYRTISTIF